MKGDRARQRRRAPQSARGGGAASSFLWQDRALLSPEERGVQVLKRSEEGELILRAWQL